MKTILFSLFAAACVVAVSSPVPAAPKTAMCLVVSHNKIEFRGRCRFTPDGRAGSFSLGSLDDQGPLYGSILSISVSIVGRGQAEVRGLTRQGINSRWGAARRSVRQPACWEGQDFAICAW